MSNRIRIAIGGFWQETNTSCLVPTKYNDFKFERGATLLNGGLRRLWHDNGAELLRELEATLPVDGIYLDLHGAMEVEEVGDAESNLVATVRELVGRDVLISVSLDLHGNISPALVDCSDLLTALRTAPHRDIEETRQRAVTLLVRALRERLKPVPVLVKPPLLLAGESAMTNVEPAKLLYGRLAEIERRPGIMDASFLIGCSWTDGPYTSTSVIVVAERDEGLARQEAAELAREVWAKRHEFRLGVEEVASVDESIRRAMEACERPVFISDSGDNVMGGAAGDIPLFAERLLALGAQDALVAGLADAEAVRQCAAVGEGAEVRLSIGGRLDPANGTPLAVTGRVDHLSTAPQEHRKEPTMAVVRVDGVSILLAVDRRGFTERAAIAAAGVDPMQHKIVVVKQGYLYPDLADHAPWAILALSPGAADLRLEEREYHRLARPIFPLDGDFTWEP